MYGDGNAQYVHTGSVGNGYGVGTAHVHIGIGTGDAAATVGGVAVWPAPLIHIASGGN